MASAAVVLKRWSPALAPLPRNGGMSFVTVPTGGTLSELHCTVLRDDGMSLPER